MADERESDAVVDLLGGIGTGPLWGMASSDLNATLLAWPPGHELVADTNSELDVLLIVLEGGGVAMVDEQARACSRECAASRERKLKGDPCRRGRRPLPLRSKTSWALADPRVAFAP